MPARASRAGLQASKPYTENAGSEWPWWDGGRLFELCMARAACKDGFPVRVDRDLTSHRVKISCALPPDGTAPVEQATGQKCPWSVVIGPSDAREGLARSVVQARAPASYAHGHVDMLTRQANRVLSESLSAELRLTDDAVIALAMDQLAVINGPESLLTLPERLAAQDLLFADLKLSAIKLKMAQLRKKATKEGFWTPEPKPVTQKGSSIAQPQKARAGPGGLGSATPTRSGTRQTEAAQSGRAKTNGEVIDLVSDNEDHKPTSMERSAAARKAVTALPPTPEETLEELLQKLTPNFDFSAYLDHFHRPSIGIQKASQLREIAKSGAVEVDFLVDELKKTVVKADGTVEAGLPGVWALRLRSRLLMLATLQ